MKKKSVNGHMEGYNYPMHHYNTSNHNDDMPEVKGSFWVACNKKSKERHSFCDGY